MALGQLLFILYSVIMESDLHCPVCSTQYGPENIPRLLVSCGHTFCHLCLDTLFIEQQNQNFRLQCPLDKSVINLSTNDVSQFPKNITLIKLIQRKKAVAAEFKEDSSLEITKIQKNEDSHGNQSWQEIINEIGSEEPSINTRQQIQQNKSQNKSSNSGKSENSKNFAAQKVSSLIRKQDQYCIVHQKPLQIFCLLDMQQICSSCAIFGQHKGHQFKSMEQIEQQSNKFRLDIFKIYDEIQQLKKRIYNEQNVKQILTVLEHRRKKMIKEVSDRYKKLRQKIKKNEQMIMKQIDDSCDITEKKIKDMICIDKKLMNQYQEWQANIFSKLQEIETGGFVQKIQILYHNNEEDILAIGESTLNRIKVKENNMINQIQEVINTIKTQYNEEIYSIIDNFTIIKIQERKVKQKESNRYDQHLLEESLLQNQIHQAFIQQPKKYTSQPFVHYQNKASEKSVFVQNNRAFSNKFQSRIVETKIEKVSNIKLKPMNSFNMTMQSQIQSFQPQLAQRPPKKKLKSIKVPEKYEKVLQALYNDTIELLDLTNAELGDAIILQICEFLRFSRVRTVKFIRNKLTDDCILRMIPSLAGVSTLNISQNYLTEQSLIHFANNRGNLPSIKNLILSQNKIIERKHKEHIERLKNMDLNLSI